MELDPVRRGTGLTVLGIEECDPGDLGRSTDAHLCAGAGHRCPQVRRRFGRAGRVGRLGDHPGLIALQQDVDVAIELRLEERDGGVDGERVALERQACQRQSCGRSPCRQEVKRDAASRTEQRAVLQGLDGPPLAVARRSSRGRWSGSRFRLHGGDPTCGDQKGGVDEQNRSGADTHPADVPDLWPPTDCDRQPGDGLSVSASHIGAAPTEDASSGENYAAAALTTTDGADSRARPGLVEPVHATPREPRPEVAVSAMSRRLASAD